MKRPQQWSQGLKLFGNFGLPMKGASQPADNPRDESYGWFRAMRHPDADQLVRMNPLSLVLAWHIARRGQYRDGFNRFNLGPGEALIGDYLTIGFTRQEYRTAMLALHRHGFATFKSTNKGTIARLTDTRLFSIFRLEGNQQNHQQPTSSQPTEQPANNQQANHFQDQKIKRSEELKEHKGVPESPADSAAQENSPEGKQKPLSDYEDWQLEKDETRMTARLNETGNPTFRERRKQIRAEMRRRQGAKQTGGSDSDNPRNAGIVRGPTDYAESAKRKLEAQVSGAEGKKFTDLTSGELKQYTDGMREAIRAA